jgi:hypothetical protein
MLVDWLYQEYPEDAHRRPRKCGVEDDATAFLASCGGVAGLRSCRDGPGASRFDDRRRASSFAVEFAGQAHGVPDEAFIEAVSRQGERVEVNVLLADGRDATARLSAADWEWLELGAGDIAPVRHVRIGGISG